MDLSNEIAKAKDGLFVFHDADKAESSYAMDQVDTLLDGTALYSYLSMDPCCA
jgi:hypothetical protein